jgi:hypothetical protein
MRLLALLLLTATVASAQDVLTIGSDRTAAGGSVPLPVTLTDQGGTALDGSSIAGVAFKVLYAPEQVASITFTPSQTPLYDQTLQGPGWISFIATFVQVPATIGTLGVTLQPGLANGTVVALTFDAPSAMLSNQAASVRESVSSLNLALGNGTIIVGTLPAPAGVTATAVSASQVSVSWSAVPGADSYQVWRSTGGLFAQVGAPAGAAFIDNTVVANSTYLYRVRTIDAPDTSPFSLTDPATTVLFTDDPLVPTVTTIKAVHITQLRTAVNAMRSAAGLTPLAADGTIGAGQRVRASHVTALRTGLDEARASLGLPPVTYSGPLTVIRAAHVTELRNGVK